MVQNQEEISWLQLLAGLERYKQPVEIFGLSGAAIPYAVAQMYRKNQRPVLVVASEAKTAERFVTHLDMYLSDQAPLVLHFPPYNILPFKFMAYHNETAAIRIGALYQLVTSPVPPIIVTTAAALAQKLIPKKELLDFAELLVAGEEIDRDALVAKLVSGGYCRTAIVEEVGDFSLRGGILDLFSPMLEAPLRIELFGDYVESLRLFSTDTQRTIKNLDEVVILPARETIVRPSQLNQVLGRIRARAAEQGVAVSAVRQIVQRIKDEGIFPGMESLLSLVFTQPDTLFDYLPKETLAVLVEPNELKETVRENQVKAAESCRTARHSGALTVEAEAIYLSWDEVCERLENYGPVRCSAFRIGGGGKANVPSLACQLEIRDTGHLSQALKEQSSDGRPFEPLADWIEKQTMDRCSVLIVCRRQSHVQRLPELLSGYHLTVVPIKTISELVPGRPGVYAITGNLQAGFSWPEAGVALISDEEIFGTAYRTAKKRQRPKPTEFLRIEDLKIGDAVVHSEHGIGRYEGLAKLGVDRSINDYLLIVYRDDDKLYLPVERMNVVQKYMGVEGVEPVLDKMGGVTWERVKSRVKRSAEKMAGKLLQLYAARKIRKGHPFGSVDTYFTDFEDGFPYEETPDQRKAIEDVLSDMRRSEPMDRLVCGDVGYGKTEVALRATFLAVSDAKQVAVLVPTTVLAEQHEATFRERFRRYPVKIAAMNRFRSKKEQREIAQALADGTIDVVVGTHRLLQKDIAFKDLGLLILDEEQRFGVRHKEKIKRLRDTVDVLALTATPIPRTLHLSLLGIRDISLISTPPEQRRPIATYISEFDDTVVAEAIRKEMSRKGQIFFVHNNIFSIERMAERLQKLVPEVRLAVAHGRMAEDELEKVMMDFTHYRIDMLVCTTIIESGLDVTAANTILINRADNFGLAQIYQLRGRVGRGEEQAYAYLFIPGESTLSKNAQKRLKVLMEYSDLGSGFQIAMSDLRIRGGGTILGASQSGHIAAVGYDMFLRLMESSIAEIKGEPLQEDLDPEVNLPISAFLPEDYIADIDQRLSIYRRLARMTQLKEISALKAELADRYGALPEEAGNLLLKIMLKVLAVRAGCKRLDLTDRQLQLQFSEAHQAKPFGVVDMVVNERKKYRFSPDHVFTAQLAPGPANSLLAQAKNILIDLSRHVNQ